MKTDLCLARFPLWFAQVNIKGKHGRTALYLAAEGGHIFIVKLLLQHPDIDVNSRYSGRGVLWNNIEFTVPLSPLFTRNGPGGATALMGASRRGHSRIVELLLQHPRCEADTSDKDGNTAVHHARCGNHLTSPRMRPYPTLPPPPGRPV